MSAEPTREVPDTMQLPAVGASTDVRTVVRRAIDTTGGILPLRPAWVAHDFLAAGYRLGLAAEDYDAGERGQIMERWLCSETHAVNTIDVPDEGMSYLGVEGADVLVADAVAACAQEILGADYARTHRSLGRLVKIYDFGTRLFMHLHQKQEFLDSQGKTSKDEAYHFLDAPLGDHPESFFGLQRYLVEQGLHHDAYRSILESWEGDETAVLKYSMGFVNVPGEGFFLDSGILHAPGTALTLEMQEPSDVGAIFQPSVQGHRIPREMLLKDVAPEDIAEYGEIDAVLRQVDWEASSDPRFFERRHLFPQAVEATRQGDLFQEWVFYGTTKFSGKRLVLPPGATFTVRERGAHNLLLWRGRGTVGSLPMAAGSFDLHRCDDEALVVWQTAVDGYDVENTGSEDLVLFSFFGPDVNRDDTPPLGHGVR